MSDTKDLQGQQRVSQSALQNIFEPDVPAEYQELGNLEMDAVMAQAVRDRAVNRSGFGFSGQALPLLSKEFVLAHSKLKQGGKPVTASTANTANTAKTAKAAAPSTVKGAAPASAEDAQVATAAVGASEPQHPQPKAAQAPSGTAQEQQDAWQQELSIESDPSTLPDPSMESHNSFDAEFMSQVAEFGGSMALGAGAVRSYKDADFAAILDIEYMKADTPFEDEVASDGEPFYDPYGSDDEPMAPYQGGSDYAEEQPRPRSRLSVFGLQQNTSSLMSWNREEQRKAEIVLQDPNTQPHLEEIKGEPVYEAAGKLQQIQPINLAYVQYLQEHYGFAQDKEQSAFNIVLLSLFAKMQGGHICVNLESVLNLLDALKPWTSEAYLEKVKALEKEEERKTQGFFSAIKLTPLMVFDDVLRKYLPLSDAELNNLILKSGAVIAQPTAQGISLEQLPELPLVWDLNRLYIRRNYIYEQQICNYIKNVTFEQYSAEQKAKIKSFIDLLFPQDKYERDSKDKGGVNWQKVAALMSLVSNFTVISGGPGTGKTTTVFNLLLLLLCLNDKNLNIMMCAPTAKAAARMGESIASQLGAPDTQKRIADLCALLGNPDKEQQINAVFNIQATTVHRLLKVRPHLVTPVYNANNKLTCDVLIVDEVSMLDLALFAKLLAALPQGCKLILLGDKDQLSSVGAGMVLGDICSILSSTDRSRIKPEVLDFICETSAYSPEKLLQGKIANHITLLQYSWRSNKVANIGKLAKIFNDAQPVDAHAYSAEIKQEVQEGRINPFRFHAILNGYTEMDLYDEPKEKSAECHRLMEEIKSLCEVYDHSGAASEESLSQQTSKQTPLVLHILPPALKQEEDLIVRKEQFSDSVQSESQRHAKEYKDKLAAYNQNINQLRFAQVQAWVDAKGSNNYGPFLKRLKELKFRVKRDSAECDELFKLMDQFRVLCSNHADWFGDNNLNELMSTEVLRTYVNNSGLFEHKFEKGEFFPGQIVLITENDPMLNLVNGSVGFCAYEDEDPEEVQDIVSKVQDVAAKLDLGQIKMRQYGKNKDAALFGYRGGLEEQRRVLRLFVRDGTGKGAVKVISTLLLSHYETGYAMSIHKSQGSEYDSVAIALSQRVNPILTKELVYTGITRAKKHVELVASQDSIEYALSHAVVRESGLAERLFGSLQ